MNKMGGVLAMGRKVKKGLSNRLFKIIGFGSSSILCLAVLTWYILSRPEIRRLGGTDLLEIMEAKTLDLRFHLRGVRKAGDEIVLIIMDEKTESELGRWQSAGRRWLAKLLTVLHKGRAKVVGFDLTLAEPDEGAVPEAITALKARYAAGSRVLRRLSRL
jgi:CHASE2 domain-containing sensor protein